MKYFLSILLLVFLIPTAVFADKVRLLADDIEALQARIDIIQQAENEILVEYFSVWNDDHSVGALALLLQAAQRGVKVKIIMDALANTVPRSMIGALEAKGHGNLEVKFYNPLNFNLLKATHRDHAKMLIVDGRIMISGGRNIGDKYFGQNKKRNYKDIDLILSGSAVSTARENYMTVWNNKSLTKKPQLYESAPEKIAANYCSPGDENYDLCERSRSEAQKKFDEEVLRISTLMVKIMTAAPEDKIRASTNTDWMAGYSDNYDIRFLSHDPGSLVTETSNTMTTQLKEFFLKAKKEVSIVTPYLIPTEGMIETFQVLIDRGVQVKIMTNSLRSTDNLFAQAGYRSQKKQLIRMGVEIYEFNGPDTLHAKVAVIDGSTNEKTALVGTYNLDPRSAQINREVGFEVKSATVHNKLADSLTEQIESFRANAVLVGKDGTEYNADKDFEGVSDHKKAMLKPIHFILPVIKNQL